MFENKIPGTYESPENKEQIKKIRIEFGELGIPKEGHLVSEDSILVDEENMLFGVFDGIGGHSAGEVASKIANEKLKEGSKRIELADGKRAIHPQQVAEQLSGKLINADIEIYKEAKNDPSKRKMGTTAAVVKLFENPEGKRFAVVASVGDSRVYLLSGGKLRKITRDDNALKELGIREKDLRHLEDKLDDVTSINDLSGDEVPAFKIRNAISNYLGSENGAIIKTTIAELVDGDKIIITSDGIHDNLATAEIEKVVSGNLPAKNISTNLVRTARDRSEELDPETGEKHLRAKRDDMSAVVIEINPPARKAIADDEITQKIIRK